MILRTLFLILLAGGVSLEPVRPRAELGEEAARARAEALLAGLESMICSLNCEFDCSSSVSHVLHEEPGGNDGGEEHTCAWSANGCRDHFCDASATDLPELESLLRGMSGPTLSDLAQSHSSMSLNAERNSAQVLGCGREVILNIPLSPTPKLGTLNPR
jgi:hypothetical protein